MEGKLEVEVEVHPLETEEKVEMEVIMEAPVVRMAEAVEELADIHTLEQEEQVEREVKD